MMGVFNKLEDAGNAVSGIIAAQVIPATMEIMDNKTIRTVEDFAKIGLPTEAKAILLIEVDGMTQDVVEQEAAAVMDVLKKNNCDYKMANTDAERDELWAARRNSLPALAGLKNTCIVEDATVPRSRITDMLVAVENIASKHDVTIGTFGHAGDGNLHPTILYNMYDKAEAARVHKAVDEIFAAALGFGGTLSGEHGIGIAKMKYLVDELGTSGLDLMKTVKEAMDPEYMFNPGKLVPAREV